MPNPLFATYPRFHAAANSEATQKDKITEAKESVRVHAGKDIYGRSVEKHLLRGRRMVIVSGEAEDEPGEGDKVDIGDNEAPIEDDDMLLLSKGNVYIKAHGDIHTTALKSVTTEVDGDEIKRTSGDVTTHHYGNTSRYVRGFTQKIVLGSDTSHSVGFTAVGRLGGWLGVLGAAGGIPYYGAGIFVWPQMHFFHSVVMATTSTIVEFKNASVVTDKSHSFAMRTGLVALKNAIARIRVSTCSTCCVGNYTEL